VGQFAVNLDALTEASGTQGALASARLAMSDFLVSPSSETAWQLDPGEFARRLQERWPAAQVREAAPDSLAALSFSLPIGGNHSPHGDLMRDGQVVGLEGGLAESAEVASWVREVVAAEQKLIFPDQGYSFSVPLTEGITRDEIVAAVEAAA